MYQLGHGTAKDLEKAALWYEKAGKNGLARAWNNMGNVYATLNGISSDTLRCFRNASQMGMAMGSYNLAQAHRFGRHGLSRDYGNGLEN